MQNNIYLAIHGSHNASITVFNDSEILEFIDIERLLNLKNTGLSQYICPPVRQSNALCNYISINLQKKYNTNKFAKVYKSHVLSEEGGINLASCFPSDNYIDIPHHFSHISGAFYQSNFNEAFGISIDGGGNDGFFNLYHCDRENGANFLGNVNLDMGVGYMLIAHYLKDIKQESNMNKGNLVYSGKLMGLAPYGNIKKEWLDAFKDYYAKALPLAFTDYTKLIDDLFKNIGIFRNNIHDRLEGQLAYDVAATTQYAFEEIILEKIQPYLEQYPNLPICFSGGCALNITLNTRIAQELNKEIFIGPNPNDSGLTIGFALSIIKPKTPYDSTYVGAELYDKELLPTYIFETNYPFKKCEAKTLARLLAENKIIGLAQGRAENGPRALGNRSILCNPMQKDMKDILNAKVKNREWYRPFAPVVKLEDVNKFFHWEKESRWMSFSPKVREEYKYIVPSVVHVDGSARVQTVTREQNEFLYDVLLEFEKITGIGMLLNTSFNVDGKPILSSVRDMFTILKNTQLDGIIVEDVLVLKN